MSSKNVDNDGKQPKGAFSTLQSVGDWMYRKGEYKTALESYTEALSIQPDDRTCLVGRAKTYTELCCFEKALEDAEASLKEDNTFYKGLYQKAEALYYMGEFEFALVYYHRGQKIRPSMEEFQMGINKSETAILNCFGSLSSVKLKNIEGDLAFLEKDKEREQPITVIQELMAEKKVQTQKSPKSKKITKEKYGELYNDRIFLEKLLRNQDFPKGKTKGGEDWQEDIRSCIESLDICTEIVNQHKPKCTPVKKQKQRSSKPRRSPPPNPAEILMRSLEEMDADSTSGNAEESVKKAEEVLKKVQGLSEKDVPNKKEVLGQLHSHIGNALVDLGDMDKALEHHQKDLGFANQSKLADPTSRALENIGRVYAQTGKHREAVAIWKRMIPLLRDGLQKTWLFHEIGHCCLELHRFKEAKHYALRSVAAADEISHRKWQISANVLVAQSEFPLGNFESCVSHFEKALAQAKLQEDQPAATAIQKILDEAKQHLSH